MAHQPHLADPDKLASLHLHFVNSNQRINRGMPGNNLLADLCQPCSQMKLVAPQSLHDFPNESKQPPLSFIFPNCEFEKD